MHDPTKMLMGATQSSDKEASIYASDPASFPAGRAVRLNSSGALSLASGDGQLIGVSLGKSLSDVTKTSVCRAGHRVPLELAAYLVHDDLTLVKKVNAAVSVEFLDTETAGSETVTVTGDADEGYLISVGMDAGTSTATQIKAALDGEAAALALIETVITGTAGDPQSALAEDVIETLGQPVVGAAVRVSNVTGKAVPTGVGALTGAQYVSGALTGVAEDASEINVALIDMGGGL